MAKQRRSDTTRARSIDAARERFSEEGYERATIRKVARGETWIQDIAVPSELTENDMVGLRVRDRLTAKELRIVALIVQGYKNKEIATQLGTTEQVIKNYLRNVYDKIGVSDRLELALFTIHHRILNEAAAATAAAHQPQPTPGPGAGVVS